MTATLDSIKGDVHDLTHRSFGVLDEYVEQLVEWVKSLDLAGWAKEQLDVLLHYVIDTAIPTLVAKAPAYVQVITSTIVIPLLKKIDEAYLH